MPVGLLTIDLHLPGCRSLKGKRRIVRRVIDRIRNRFNVSVAEVDHQDLWQRTTVAVAVVSNDYKFSDSVLTRVVKQVEGDANVQVVEYNLTML